MGLACKSFFNFCAMTSLIALFKSTRPSNFIGASNLLTPFLCEESVEEGIQNKRGLFIAFGMTVPYPAKLTCLRTLTKLFCKVQYRETL
jgi:hypothetical protein